MSVVQTLGYTCSCGATGEAEVRRSWVLDEPAEFMPIMTNQFHRFHCASCKQLIMLDIDLLVTLHAKQWVVYVVRDDAARTDAAKMMKETFPDYRGRVVATRMELMEKVRLFAAEIDDVAFAIAKYQKRMVLNDFEGKLKLYFDKVTGDQIEVVVLEPGVGVKGTVNVPRELVDKFTATFETKEYAKFAFVDDALAMKVMKAYQDKRAAAAPAPAAAAPTAAPTVAPFSALHSRGRDAAGVAYVTDGGIILREDAVAALGGALTYAPQMRELTTAQLAGVFAGTVTVTTPLDALYPSGIYGDTLWRTRDGVPLSTRYVQLARKLPGPIQCQSTGQRSPVRLVDARGLLGAVMPTTALPERDEGLPEPADGAWRVKLAVVHAAGGGTVFSKRGELTFAATALHGAKPTDLVVGALVDGYAVGDTFGPLWPAGIPRPAAAAIPAEPPPPSAPVTRPSNFVSAFATRFSVGGVTKIQSIAHIDCPATPHSPAHVMHVVQRVLTDDVPEGWRFVCSDGLSARPVVAHDRGSLQRFEIATYTRRHDPALLDSLASLGEEIHRMTSVPGAAPVALGHTIALGTPGLRGWPLVLLSRMTQPIEGPYGPTDIVRIVPITAEEREELRSREDFFDGWGFVTGLENRDFLGLVDRWYAHVKTT